MRFRRLLAWMAERFPVANILGVVLVWAAAFVWGRAFTTQGPVAVRARDAAAALAAVAFFLMLRIFDEHKDYASDCITHPGRVLQRGLITLRDLKMIGVLVIAVQLSASILADGGGGPVTRAWIAAFAWSLLMAREFFVREWLRPRLVLYALSHMVVMPLAVFWMIRMSAGTATLPASIWMLPLVSYLTGFAFEIARKLKAPADERDNVDSYTKALGTHRAPMILAAVLTSASIGFVGLLAVVADGAIVVIGGALLAGVLLMALMALLRFRRNPDAATAKACESMVGLTVGVSHIVLLIVVLTARGFAVV
jgi:4-hydroxybenzoate polyprenyltransferase